MKRGNRVLAGLAALAVLVAIYCFLGVVMNVHFSLATESIAYTRAAAVWGLASLMAFAGAIVLARVAWKHRQGRKDE